MNVNFAQTRGASAILVYASRELSMNMTSHMNVSLDTIQTSIIRQFGTLAK